jgi:hypothetical protein
MKKSLYMKSLYIGATLFVFQSLSFATPVYAATQYTQNIDQKVELLRAKSQNLDPKVLKLALEAYDCAALSGAKQNQTLTVIDYSMSSAEKRMWVFDLANNQLLFNSLVAHGQGSGTKSTAQHFSNTSSTHASSLGVFLTGSTYPGKHGESLKLHGLEYGFNDKAESRSIVVHGAAYVNEANAKSGAVGRSWGCPAVPQNMAKPIINTIKDRGLVFAYYPDQKWLQESKYLNCPVNLASLKRNTA